MSKMFPKLPKLSSNVVWSSVKQSISVSIRCITTFVELSIGTVVAADTDGDKDGDTDGVTS